MSFLVGIRNLLLRIVYRVFRPLIFLMDPENAHYAFKRVGVFLGSNFITRFITSFLFDYGHKSLKTNVDGIEYRNPVGLSAGFDKDGELTKVYPSIGFGLAELGSFTGEVCPGNPGKRLFRMVKSKSILVWYGLNNQGAEKISARLKGVNFGRLKVGINAAKSNITPEFDLQDSIDDYLKTVKLFKDAEIGDYFTINISCPNTQDGEPFVDRNNLEALIKAVQDEVNGTRPVYVKLAADMELEEINIIVDTCMDMGVEGVVLTNLAKPSFNKEFVESELPFHKGAMSGLPLQRISTNVIRHVYRRTRGKLTIIGVGGVFSAKDAYEKITSGASLLHMITTLIFDGPQNISEINRGLVQLLKADGFDSIEEAVGSRNPLPKIKEAVINDGAQKEPEKQAEQVA